MTEATEEASSRHVDPAPMASDPPVSLRPYAFVLAAVILGGLAPVFTKLLLLRGVEGPTIVAARYALAVFLLLPFGLPHRTRQGPPPDRRAWITLILVGAFGSGVGALLFTAAVDLASAGVVNAISKTAPIFVALFSYFTLRERVTYLRLLLIGVMVAADVLIVAGELTFSGQLVSARLLGDLLALGAGMTRAAAEILGKSALRRFQPSTVALWRFGVGLIIAAGVSAGTGGWGSLQGLDAGGWGILLALAWVSTALYMALYYRGLSEIPAHVAVSLRLLGAIVTVIVSWFVLGEALTPYHIAGIAVLLSGAYLLVLRSAQPVAPTAAARPVRRPWTRLRPRLVGLVILLVSCSVGVVWYLSVRHSAQLIHQQVQLTVGEIAAILVEFGGLEERPSWQSYQQYLQRVVGHRVEGHTYALEVVYVAALDPRGNIGAFATTPELEVMGKSGHAYRAHDRESMRQLLAAMEGPARRRDFITATANLVIDGQIVGSLRMGCKREISEGMVGEIVGRSAVAALTVLLLAAAITAVVIGGIMDPIERLAADLSAPPGDGRADANEVEQIRRALGVVGEAIGLERRTITALSVGLAARTIDAEPIAPPKDRAWLAVNTVGAPELADFAAQIEAVAREAARQGGVLAGAAGGVVMAHWGAERDDALRAVLAARAVSEALAGRVSAPVTIAVGVGKDASGWASAREQAGADAGTGAMLVTIIGPEAYEDAAAQIVTGPGGPDEWRVLEGLGEPEALRIIAREPED